MTKDEIIDRLTKFSRKRKTREEIRIHVSNMTINNIIDYIYDASNVLADIKNDLENY
jgi:hypothetical protein